MNDHKDPLLETLFAEARVDLEDAGFSERVVSRTRNRTWILLGSLLVAAITVILMARLVFEVPLLDLALLASEALGTPLINLGEGWLALVFLPVNNVAGLLVLGARLLLMLRKKLVGTALIR